MSLGKVPSTARQAGQASSGIARRMAVTRVLERKRLSATDGGGKFAQFGLAFWTDQRGIGGLGKTPRTGLQGFSYQGLEPDEFRPAI